MTSIQTAIFIVAMMLGVAGFSLSVSASAIPRVPRFKIARRQIALFAVASLATSVALMTWVFRG